jgi:hypothetical protein
MKASTRKCEKKIVASAARASKKMRVGSMVSGVRVTKAMKAKYNKTMKSIIKKTKTMCGMSKAGRVKTAKKMFSSIFKR